MICHNLRWVPYQLRNVKILAYEEWNRTRLTQSKSNMPNLQKFEPSLWRTRLIAVDHLKLRHNSNTNYLVLAFSPIAATVAHTISEANVIVPTPWGFYWNFSRIDLIICNVCRGFIQGMVGIYWRRFFWARDSRLLRSWSTHLSRKMCQNCTSNKDFQSVSRLDMFA